MKKVVHVTRVYEIPEEEILARLESDENLSDQDKQIEMNRIARKIAMEWYASEMDEFINNPEDFASPNVVATKK